MATPAVQPLKLGSDPRFPAASKKRGMARAIEVVQWMADYASARECECRAAQRALTADVFHLQVVHYQHVVEMLKKERR